MVLGTLNTCLFLLCATLCSTSSNLCVRHIKYHYVSRDGYDLGYLSKLYNILHVGEYQTMTKSYL